MFLYAVGHREFNACDSADETGSVAGQKVTKGVVRCSGSRSGHPFSRNTTAMGLDGGLPKVGYHRSLRSQRLRRHDLRIRCHLT